MGCTYILVIESSEIYLERTSCLSCDKMMLLEGLNINKNKINDLEILKSIINKILNNKDLIKKAIIIFIIAVDNILDDLKKELKDEEKIINAHIKEFKKFKNDYNNKDNIKKCFNIFKYIYEKKQKLNEKSKKNFIFIMENFLKGINETNSNKKHPIFEEDKIKHFKNYLENLFQAREREIPFEGHNSNIADVNRALDRRSNSNFDNYSEHSQNQIKKMEEEKKKLEEEKKKLEEKINELESRNKQTEEEKKQTEEKNKELEERMKNIEEKLNKLLDRQLLKENNEEEDKLIDKSSVNTNILLKKNNLI